MELNFTAILAILF